MMEDKPYIFGHPDNPKDAHERFETPEQAVQAAIEHQHYYPFDSLLVVWHDATDVILHVVLNQEVFNRG